MQAARNTGVTGRAASRSAWHACVAIALLLVLGCSRDDGAGATASPPSLLETATSTLNPPPLPQTATDTPEADGFPRWWSWRNGRPPRALASTPDPDAVALSREAVEVTQVAQQRVPGAVLHQVGFSTPRGARTFMFTDAAVTRQVEVTKNRPDSSVEEFIVVEPSTTWPYQGPGLDLPKLSVGPETVAAAAYAHWPACDIRGLTLGRTDSTLTWWIFCDLSEELEALGTLDVQTREFRPSNPMPRFRPPTATPSPSG